MKLRKQIDRDQKLWCPHKKPALVITKKMIWCQHCKASHIAPPCTTFCCMHMLKDPKTHEYLTKNWPEIVEIWERYVDHQKGRSVRPGLETNAFPNTAGPRRLVIIPPVFAAAL